MKLGIARYVAEHNLSPILDICCGTGRQGYLIGINRQNIIGLDRDRKMVQYAQSKYPSIPFICADAADIPLKNAYFKGIVISYSLHDKPPELRTKMLSEAKRLLAPEGKMILVDFELPWNRWSRLAGIFTYLIERTAGKEHFRNSRQFLKQGGLRALIKQNGIVEIERYDIELGNSSMVIAQFA
jgi:demethylmenaquinone methyltransferase/2-methoxy-6-polyprenyl-1,4-benzoquinol methylase